MIFLRNISIALFLIFFSQLASGQNDVDRPLSQKLTLQLKNETLKESLYQLEQHGNFTFAYAENTVDLGQTISINATNLSISKILRILFPDTIYKFKNVGSQVLIYKSKRDTYYTISGYVKEKGTLETLPDASIYIPDLQHGTTTNGYGFFSLKIKKGSYQVAISYLGYRTQYKDIAVDQDKTINITLEAITETIDEVVVIGYGYEKPTKSGEMSRLKISDKQVQTTPVLLGEKDILKTLQLTPGIQSGPEGSAQVFTRGGSPDQNLTILDEATVYNSNHLFGFLSVYNVDAVKSARVYKGAFPSHYGGRLSGVVDIAMKDGNKEQLSGSVNAGLLAASFTLEGPIVKDSTSFFISGRRSFADLIAQPIQANNDNKIKLYFYDINAKIHHILDAKNNFYLSSYLGQDAFNNTSQKQTNRTDERLKWGNITTTARWNHQYSDVLFSNLSLIYSSYSLKATYQQSDSDVAVIADSFDAFSGINDYGVKASFDYLPNAVHDINFGLHSTLHRFVPERKNLVQQNGISASNEQQLNSLESAVYFEDVLTLSRKLKTTAGIRLNFFKTTGQSDFSIEPRVSLAYRFKTDYAFKASYTQMNQYVHLLSNTGTGLPTDLWVSATENVAPQRSQQLAFGLSRDFGTSGYALEIEGYYKKFKNVITYKEGASFLDIQNVQTGQNVSWQDNITSGKGWAYGSELLFRKQKGKLQGWLGYTLSWSQRQFDDINNGKKFFSKYDQRHNISIVGSYTPTDKITGSASWVYQTGTNFTVPNLLGLSSDTDFPISTGGSNFNPTETTQFTARRNNLRGEATHRLNLAVQFHKKTKRDHLRTWSFSIYNVYARKNPFYYYVSDGSSSGIGLGNSNGNVERSLRRVSPLVFIPSVNYSYKF